MDKTNLKDRLKEIKNTYLPHQWLVQLYLITMLFIFPIFFDQKYYDMGIAKYSFFKYATLIMLVGIVLIFLGYILTGELSGIIKKRPVQKTAQTGLFDRFINSLSVTDLAVILYTIVAVMSWALSPFRKETFVGSNDWYMGLLSQLLFTGIYFAVSRFVKFRPWLLWLAAIGAIIPFITSYLHRFDIDPLGLYEGLKEHAKILFLGTIGQATWYSSYVCIILPLFMTVYQFMKKNKQKNTALYIRIALIAFLLLGFGTAFTQNSDSMFISLGFTFLVLFWFALENMQLWTRFLELLLICMVSAKGTGILQLLFPDRVPTLDTLSLTATQHNAGWLLLALIAILYLVTRYISKNYNEEHLQQKSPAWLRRFRLILYLIIVAIIVSMPIIVWLATTGRLTIGSDILEKTGYFIFDENWGNGRGKTWMYSARIFAEFPASMKLFGCGPDGMTFYSIAYHTEEITEMWGGLQLTNAHNEWLTALLHYGIIGSLAYITIFISIIVRTLKNWRTQPLYVAVAVAILSYMGHNLFCYQQCICTPLIFIVMGCADYLLTRAPKEVD